MAARHGHNVGAPLLLPSQRPLPQRRLWQGSSRGVYVRVLAAALALILGQPWLVSSLSLAWCGWEKGTCTPQLPRSPAADVQPALPLPVGGGKGQPPPYPRSRQSPAANDCAISPALGEEEGHVHPAPPLPLGQGKTPLPPAIPLPPVVSRLPLSQCGETAHHPRCCQSPLRPM
jgi:hypothetical protein